MVPDLQQLTVLWKKNKEANILLSTNWRFAYGVKGKHKHVFAHAHTQTWSSEGETSKLGQRMTKARRQYVGNVGMRKVP